MSELSIGRLLAAHDALVAYHGRKATRLERLVSIQSRLRARWRSSIDAGDRAVAGALVTRLRRITLAVWAEKAISP